MFNCFALLLRRSRKPQTRDAAKTRSLTRSPTKEDTEALFALYATWGELAGGRENVLAVLQGASGLWPQERNETFRLIRSRTSAAGSNILVTEGLSRESFEPFPSVPAHAGCGIELWLESSDDFDRAPMFQLLLYLSNLCASGALRRSALDEFGGISVEVPVEVLGGARFSHEMVTAQGTVGLLIGGFTPPSGRIVSIHREDGYEIKFVCCRVINAEQLDTARNGGRKPLIAQLEELGSGWLSTFGELIDEPNDTSHDGMISPFKILIEPKLDPSS